MGICLHYRDLSFDHDCVVLHTGLTYDFVFGIASEASIDHEHRRSGRRFRQDDLRTRLFRVWMSASQYQHQDPPCQWLSTSPH